MKNTLILLISLMVLGSCKSQNHDHKINKDSAETALPINNVKELTTANLAAGELKRIDSFPSKYIIPRPVDVWLPANYSQDKNYSVLYMHDGQNLFDATTTWNKQEWMVDEIATKLIDSNTVEAFIVVGIHNIPKIRWQDLFPEKAINYLSATDSAKMEEEAKKNNFEIALNGDHYLKFIVEELKPFIDATYATKTNSENTFVAGSSMGGLMSMYAICEYPEVFGGAACLSTHWPGTMPKDNNPIPKAIFDYLTENLPNPENHKLYFDFGTETLDHYYPQYEETVNTIFRENGYDDSNFKNLKFEGTDHSEKSWQKRFDIPLTFLLKKE